MGDGVADGRKREGERREIVIVERRGGGKERRKRKGKERREREIKVCPFTKYTVALSGTV